MVNFIIEYWVEVAFTAFMGVLAYGYRKLEKKIREQEAISLGVQAMLRNMIVQSYNNAIKQGYCKIYELENVEAMYKQYHDLGGNGAISSLIERMREMPTQPVKPGTCPKASPNCAKEAKCDSDTTPT